MGRPTINGGVLQTMKVAGRIPEVGRKPSSPSGITLWEALQLLIGNGAHEPQEPKGFFEKIQFLEKKGCGGSPKSSSSSKQRDVSWVPKSRRLLFFGRFQSSIPPWRIFGSLKKHQHSRSWWTKNHGKHQIFISLWMAKPWVSCHFSPWNQNINTPIEIPVPAIPIEMAVCPTTY